MNELYHYTSVDTLLLMLQNKSLRTTDYRYLNDSREFQVLSDVIETLIAAHPVSGAAVYVVERRPPDSCRMSHGEYRSRAWKYAKNFLSSFTYAGVACFSECDNDLSQWRAYSKLGIGISIKFDKDELTKCAKDLGCALVPCNYGLDDATRDAKDWIDHVDLINGEEDSETAVDYYMHKLLDLVAIYKDSSFSGEREWRLVKNHFHPNPPRGSSLDREQQEDILSLKFMTGMYSARPYCDLFFQQGPSCKERWFTERKLPIKSIMVGPTREPDLAVRAVRLAIRANGIALSDDDVIYCGIPFRQV